MWKYWTVVGSELSGPPGVLNYGETIGLVYFTRFTTDHRIMKVAESVFQISVHAPSR